MNTAKMQEAMKEAGAWLNITSRASASETRINALHAALSEMYTVLNALVQQQAPDQAERAEAEYFEGAHA